MPRGPFAGVVADIFDLLDVRGPVVGPELTLVVRARHLLLQVIDQGLRLGQDVRRSRTDVALASPDAFLRLVSPSAKHLSLELGYAGQLRHWWLRLGAEFDRIDVLGGSIHRCVVLD